MKKIFYSIALTALAAVSCVNLDISPKNIVSDDNLLSNQAGIGIYLASMYRQMPWEDFKYMAEWGVVYNSWLGAFGIEGTGEAVGRDCCSSFTGERSPWWGNSYKLIHDANHLIAALDGYRNNFSELTFNEFKGQGYFVRAYCYLQMARRYGGVPLVLNELDPGADGIDLPRASEKDTWNQILADFDMAVELLPENATFKGEPDKYAALSFKAEAMLYAGSVAKYNEQVTGRLSGIGQKSGNRVIGFEADESAALSKKWFAEAYKAAREIMKSGRYSLYRKAWKAGDKQAQFQNMIDMWFDGTSPENILVRYYEYPTLTHGLDAYSGPFTYHAPLSSATCPTLEFINLFDGLDKTADGYLRVTDGADHATGNYLLFDNPMDIFKNVEPRLRAYVILPNDVFRGKTINVRQGVYTGPTPIKPFLPDYSFGGVGTRFQNSSAYTGTPKTLFMSPNNGDNQEYIDIDGVKTAATGTDGPFYNNAESTNTGIYLRKYLDPNKTLEDTGEGKSDQDFILMRYADVLLAAAEAGVELSIAGVASPVEGDDMLKVATDAINDIRNRAGAEELTTGLTADNTSRDIVRKERRKELAFEHKSKWDIRRWRVIDEDNRDGFWGEKKDASLFSNGTQFRFRGLYPFYSTQARKWFFDEAYQQIATRTMDYTPVDYYFAIPGGEVSKSKFIDQQPNR